MENNQQTQKSYDVNFLKNLKLLYVEDDKSISEQLELLLKTIFKETIVCQNGLEGLEAFKESLTSDHHIDVIVCDINMPVMNGIDMLKEVRSLNANIPFIFTTAHSDSQYTIEAIQNGVSNYIIKPVNVKDILISIQELCEVQYNIKVIKHQHDELERYIEVINQVAIISKTDAKGIITFVNDIFCEVSKYTKEELIGQNQNIVRHPDMSSSIFKELWNDIKSGKEWKGKVKNKTKDGESYYVNATIFPIYDDFTDEIIEYVGIRFLTTQEENEKREFKKKFMQTYQESKKRDSQSKATIDELQSKLKLYENFDLIEDSLEYEKKNNKKLKLQIDHYEDTMKEVKDKYEEKIQDVSKIIKEATIKQRTTETQYKLIKTEYEKLSKKYATRDDEFIKTLEQLQGQAKIISDLRDVIKHREEEIKKLSK